VGARDVSPEVMLVPAALATTMPPVKAGLDGSVTGSCSQGSEQVVLGFNRATELSLGVCTFDTITAWSDQIPEVAD
jgi:hypothetical protein